MFEFLAERFIAWQFEQSLPLTLLSTVGIHKWPPALPPAFPPAPYLASISAPPTSTSPALPSAPPPSSSPPPPPSSPAPPVPFPPPPQASPAALPPSPSILAPPPPAPPTYPPEYFMLISSFTLNVDFNDTGTLRQQ